MAARHHELIYLHRLMVAARHTSKKAEPKQKCVKKSKFFFLLECVLERKMVGSKLKIFDSSF